MAKRDKATPEHLSTAPQPSGADKDGSAAPLPLDRQPTPSRVVGIGASAGGLEAFRELLHALPVDSGMAFVIVQHLARDQKSMLPDILSRSTAMPVVEIMDATTIRANHVYVMSPNTDVEYARGALVVRKRETGSGTCRSTGSSRRSPKVSATSPSA